MGLYESVKTYSQAATKVTADATPVSAQEIIIPVSSQMKIQADVDCLKDDLTAFLSERVEATFVCSAAGVVTQQGSTVYPYRKRTTGYSDITFNLATANKIKIYVTGKAGTDLTWKITSHKNLTRI